MFIRTKKRKNGNFSMQIVQNTRIDGTTKQKVIKHVGTVSKEEDLEELKKFGYYLLRQIEEEEENLLFNLNESDKINQSREYSKSISHKTIDDNVLWDFPESHFFMKNSQNILFFQCFDKFC